MVFSSRVDRKMSDAGLKSDELSNVDTQGYNHYTHIVIVHSSIYGFYDIKWFIFYLFLIL